MDIFLSIHIERIYLPTKKVSQQETDFDFGIQFCLFFCVLICTMIIFFCDLVSSVFSFEINFFFGRQFCTHLYFCRWLHFIVYMWCFVQRQECCFFYLFMSYVFDQNQIILLHNNDIVDDGFLNDYVFVFCTIFMNFSRFVVFFFVY